MGQPFLDQFLQIVNAARGTPKQFSQHLKQQFKQSFQGDQLRKFEKTIQTFQGQAVVRQLQKQLSCSSPTEQLLYSQALCQAASAMAQFKGVLGHTHNQQPKQLYEAIKHHCSGRVGSLTALNTWYGKETAYLFLLDDGLATRKRRMMLLDPAYRYVGVGYAQHKHHKTITIVLLAQSIQPENQSSSFVQRVK